MTDTAHNVPATLATLLRGSLERIRKAPRLGGLDAELVAIEAVAQQLEEIAAGDGFVPPPKPEQKTPSTGEYALEIQARSAGFHRHLDACAHCRDHPFALCVVGNRLLSAASLC